MPETRVSIIIKGHNFGNDADVWIGNKLCECLPNNDNEIECIVPMPTFYFINGLFVTVKRNDLGYTNSVKKLINYKQNRVPVLFAPAISPLYLYPDNDGDVTIPINADLILPFCRCFIRNSGLIEGIFDYQSQVYSECVIEDDSSSGDYNVEVCCYGVCSSDTYTVHILTSILYSVTPNRGHNHGLYNVAGVLSFLGTYMASDIIFLVDDVYIGFSDLNSNSFAFQMPPIEDAAIDKIRISVNHGYSFTNDNWSTDFDFTGRCDIGEFINENLCEDCPVGNYCDENFLTSTAYFFSHKPCDLGEYQDLTGQSSCKTCPVGRQCYCRGMSETAECDAGYVCSDTGTIKRFRACTNGAYCLPGTTKSKSEDDISDNPNSPIKCDIGTYCIYGIYDKTVNDSDKYTAKNCDVPANCPRGSTNRQGLRDCQWGFFCIDLVSITRVGLLDSNDLDELCDDDGKCSCPRGYSCPSSVLTAPKQCDSGYYQDLEEQGTCKLCDSGYYCTNTNSQAPESRTICTLGNRCPSMSTKPTKCPVGTYQDKTGQTDCKNCPIGTYNNQLGRSSCKICESGFMCAEEGISTNKLLCPDGYYCGIGTNMNKPECDINFKSDNKTEIYPIPCNTGTQCQGGSGTFKLCGLRMYNGETCQSSCKFCPNGTTCTTTGMSKPELCKEGYACYDFASVLCKAGHYCLEGTETNDPKNTATEKRPLPCSKGHYCTGGNTMGTYLSSKRNSAAYCNIGQYNNETGAISCKNCPAGHECLKTEMTEPILCLGGT